MILERKIRTRSVRRRNARGARRKRRSETKRNTAMAMKIRMTMLTSVVQVLASIGTARNLASRSTDARRARARLPSGTLEAMVSRMMPAAMDKSEGMASSLRAGMVAVVEAPDMVARKRRVTVTRSTVANKRFLVTVDVPEARVTAAKRIRLDMVVSNRATVVMSPWAMEADRTAVVVAKVKSPLALTVCPVVLGAMTSPVSDVMVKSTRAAAATTMRMSMVAADTKEVATAAKDTVAGTSLNWVAHCTALGALATTCWHIHVDPT